ncbi:RagB/SusD family nutrient uptake outer membrane protein [Cytophagaceae bacterium DM2B3-1]|uniref:RagB/SusD family nutrient uptake outer membrane protein n=1 Tax=Xanthocytophaga flava TaxID=3048013 RepID=A0ABT7CJU9_9BACT|nr:RagB/SusD family nutrient uptake outer membrane protein [Xanthocytophaga flavus]MDJ1469474.1 RagB/SusD family nutrient uptake outer membrane protein [Xanthocytophaga flavus]MDJ1494014.1 RagB/SusD family nutrient uptake outer membrane protein [Xanthocytophaga flavus]
MKHTLIVIGISLILFGIITSCSKEFLDVPVQGQGTTKTDPALAQNLVTGVYNSLLAGEAFGGDGGDTHGISFIAATNIMSDDADKGSTPSDQSALNDIDNFTISPTNTFVAALWNGYYTGISKANQALVALSTASLTDATRNQLMGEVRFIRGYYYFNLVRLFGKVPKVLRVPKDAQDANTDPEFQTRASVDTIYNVIIQDLQFAVNNLPLRSNASVGHVDKGAAQTLLAKVYMYRKEWQKVFDLTQEVISSGQYDLVADYSTIWRQVGDNSIESVFEIQTGQFNNSDYGIQGYSVWQGPRVGGKGGWTDLGFGFGTPSANLVNAYEPNDVRKASTIIFIDNSGQHKGTVLFDGFRIPSADSVQNLYYNYKAYHSENSSVETFNGNRDRKQKNVHLLRYAEVLLMNAEAANELGQSNTATMLLNRIRKRAGLQDTNASSQTDVREAIWKERRFELAMEHDRFFDLVRQGRAAQVMQAAGKNFVAGKNELLPVPSLQIALSGGQLDQNNGY